MSLPRPIVSIDPAEAARRLEADDESARPLLVDVREPDEFAAQRIPGAVHVPLSSLQQDYTTLPQGRPLILQCASGRRSFVAAQFLQQRGYGDVSNLEGGIDGWRKAGLPVEAGAAKG
ncbi:MAG TPA: rhodanese-like domain-containing protein [Candidatus Limnocylindrales bacterium]|nr:rhodanese-like domain-containing protein [Candidatus Limnocylindrales bacterium]